MKIKSLLIALTISLSFSSFSQVDPDQMGGWYMYFWNTTFKEGPWGIQGDIQHRNWNTIGDLEQLLIRGGLTYKPEGWDVKFTFGYGNVSKGTFGTDDASKIFENRIYQEALYPHMFGKRIKLVHRFRYEQRWNHEDDFRTRYRYNIFINYPITNPTFEPKTIYASFYNELFMNGEKEIGNGNTVEYFDLNRTYFALGYVLNEKLKVQAGIMKQSNNNYAKNQLQLSLHQTW